MKELVWLARMSSTITHGAGELLPHPLNDSTVLATQVSRTLNVDIRDDARDARGRFFWKEEGFVVVSNCDHTLNHLQCSGVSTHCDESRLQTPKRTHKHKHTQLLHNSNVPFTLQLNISVLNFHAIYPLPQLWYILVHVCACVRVPGPPYMSKSVD